MSKPIVLSILDGFALREEEKGNAVLKAKKDNLLNFWNNYSHTSLRADGLAVGLPEGQMGNSEVGHMNMGSGRTVYQSLVLINKAIEDGSFFENKVYIDAINHAKENDSAIHIMGLLSDGGVHSHIEHIKAMIKMANDNGIEKIYVHGFLDGRDVAPKSAKEFIEEIEKVNLENNATLVSVSGRYYSMDRDKRWDRVKKAYDTIILGQGPKIKSDILTYIDESYDNDIYDEFIEPAQIETYEGAKDGDSFVFMNFRPDRAMQLAAVLTNEDYDPKKEDPIFKTTRPKNICFVQTMKYSDDVKGKIAFNHQKINNTLGEVVSKAGLKQLRIAETEKYPHITFFFDGGIDVELEGANRILINSPKVATYDLKPEMSAQEVTDNLIKELKKEELDLVILNFANPDMVGHSGKLEPTIKAIETVDDCLGQIYKEIDKLDGTLLITADHGNSEKVINEDDTPNTAHTINPVPFVLVDKKRTLKDEQGTLADIAPTILDLLEIDKPKEMTGNSLLNEEL